MRPGRSPAARTDGVLEAGDAAPDFTLPYQDCRALSLSDLRGQNVVLYFYPAPTAAARQFSLP